MRFVLQPVETLVTALFLLITLGVFWPPMTYLSKQAAQLDASDPISVVMHAALLAFLVVVGVVRWPQMVEAARRAWPLILLLALAYLSAFWSDAPELVLRRATTLAATTLFAVYLMARFDLARLVRLLVVLYALTALASYIVMAVAPQLGLSGTEDYPTAWRGIHTAKNVLGSVCGFGIIIASYALWRGYGPRWLAALVVPADLVLLFMAQSATPLIVLAAAAYTAIVASAFQRRNGPSFLIGFVLLVGGLLAAGLLAIAWTDILAALGRDPTLTGRAGIWDAVIGVIERRPLLGYGYGAFWRQDAIEARTIWGVFHWTVPHAHNSWLEIGLALGMLGMLGVTLVWIIAFYRGVRVLLVPDGRHGVFCLALLVAMLVVNLTEYEFLRPDTFLWVLFTVTFTHLGQEVARHHVARGLTARPRQLARLDYPAPHPT